jgi:hypothetical protein
MRSPSSGFSDSKMRPSFLSTTPAKNPRTECCCQPVAFMMAGIVEPRGRRNSSRTSACLDFVATWIARASGGRRFSLRQFLTSPCGRAFVWSFRSPLAMRRLTPSPPQPRGGRMALAVRRFGCGRGFPGGASYCRGTTHARFGSEVERNASNLVALLPASR